MIYQRKDRNPDRYEYLEVIDNKYQFFGWPAMKKLQTSNWYTGGYGGMEKYEKTTLTREEAELIFIL